ncbi:MAG: alpha-L-fucosidase, partial [Niameybacter sp.]
MQQWFTDAKLGIFIHYGIYAVKGVSESWSFYHNRLTHEEYLDQLNGFTAKNFDAD